MGDHGIISGACGCAVGDVEIQVFGNLRGNSSIIEY